MGARLAHLKRRSDFLRARAHGQSCAAKGLVLQMRLHGEDELGPEGLHGPRVGFTVSRKVGGAVVRNRVKRRLRALADELLADGARPPGDYVLIGRKATLRRPYSALLGDLRWALRKVGANGVGANGVGANGVGANGVGANGVGANGRNGGQRLQGNVEG